MKTIPRFWLQLCLLVSALALQPARATLIHRYSFTSDASDSVGTAHGTNLVINATNTPVAYSGGQAVMDGTGGYIRLPGGLVSGLTNVSIEIWATYSGVGNDWQRFFDFGNTDAGGTGEFDMFLTPQYGGSGGKLRFGIANADPGYSSERDVSSSNMFPIGTEAYVVLTYGPSNVMLYVNGVLDSAGSASSYFPLSVLQDVYDYIGRSVYNADPAYNGSFNEFRIHDSILSSPQVAASFASGPDTINYDPGAVTAIAFTNLQVAVSEGDFQYPQFLATYARAGAVVIGVPDGVTVTSDNTNVIVFRSGGLFAKAPGTATVTGSMGGITTPPVTITVGAAVPVLVHRYSFSDPASSTTIADSVGSAAGTLVPDSTGTTNVVLANGEAVFSGPLTASYTTAPYIALPGGLFTTMTNLTIEVWATWQGANAAGATTWQRIFDFGDSTKGGTAQNAGNGQDSLYLTVRDGGGNSHWDAFIPAGGGGETALIGPGQLPIGQQVHLTCIYAPNRRSASYYVNGVVVATGDAANPLSALSPDGNNWVGASQWNDPPFHGSISEIRIYEGVLSDVTVAVSQTTGPDMLPQDPGTIQSLTLSAPPLIPGNPYTVQPYLLGNFQHANNVNISGVSGVTYAVGDTNVFIINATGGMRAVTNLGTSTLIAFYQGLSATTTVSVVAPVSVTVTNLPATAVFDGPNFRASLLATFPGATNIDVSAFAGTTWTVSDPSLAVISANGTITPLSSGTLTVSGTHRGVAGSAQVVLGYAAGSGPAVLIHRYSFSDSNVVDSVGGANGEAQVNTLKPNPNPVVFTNGQAVMDGTGGYISLPPGLVSGLSNLTVEAWVTWNGGGAWQNLFVFGNTDAGGAGMFGLFGTPNYGGSNGKFRLGFGNADPGYNNEFDVSDSNNFFPTNTPAHLVVVYAPVDGGTRIYINGQFHVSGGAPDPLSALQDVLNYLGRSGYNADPAYNGSIDEFRIYDGALSGVEVANDYIAGPNMNAALPPLSVHLSNGQLVFTWSLSASNSTLMVSKTLGASASWGNANATVIQTNGVYSATVTPTNSSSFYRLQR
ncbi:MAG TPA: LamG-like jellyroll fold domain-containing protein [Candidatus Limnocylindrales bacterium]|jgi:hypothetical protein|nr:LamG-like jellyroll fold domain-containing protein [Candidatus Limnocylindrales bacterium]